MLQDEKKSYQHVFHVCVILRFFSVFFALGRRTCSNLATISLTTSCTFPNRQISTWNRNESMKHANTKYKNTTEYLSIYDCGSHYLFLSSTLITASAISESIFCFCYINVNIHTSELYVLGPSVLCSHLQNKIRTSQRLKTSWFECSVCEFSVIPIGIIGVPDTRFNRCLKMSLTPKVAAICWRHTYIMQSFEKYVCLNFYWAKTWAWHVRPDMI